MKWIEGRGKRAMRNVCRRGKASNPAPGQLMEASTAPLRLRLEVLSRARRWKDKAHFARPTRRTSGAAHGFMSLIMTAVFPRAEPIGSSRITVKEQVV